MGLLKIMEKKKYISPECTVVEMEILNMIAASVGVGDDNDYNDPNDMSNRHRGEWGDLWAGRK